MEPTRGRDRDMRFKSMPRLPCPHNSSQTQRDTTSLVCSVDNYFAELTYWYSSLNPILVTGAMCGQISSQLSLWPLASFASQLGAPAGFCTHHSKPLDSVESVGSHRALPSPPTFQKLPVMCVLINHFQGRQETI